MDINDPLHQDSAVHTLSDETNSNQTHLLLKASEGQTEYVNKLEERLAELERKFEELFRKNTEAPSEAGLSESSRDTLESAHSVKNEQDDQGSDVEDQKEDQEEKPARTILPTTRKLNYINFMNRFPFQTEISAVEALMINTTMKAADEEDASWFRERPTQEREKRIRDMLEKNAYNPDAWMARIRINAVPLVAEVMKVLGASEEFFVDSVTFIQPFHPLVHSYDKLKARLQEMKNALATQSDQPTCNITGAETDDKSDATAETKPSSMDPAELVSLMGVFVRFLEDEVLSVPPKTGTKIRFESLSSIFKLGDTIFDPGADKGIRPTSGALIDRSDQRLWRIYCIKRNWDSESSDLDLKAYAIEYDGVKYVGRKEKFSISPFDGEEEITNLEVFPLRYHENAEKIQAEARAWGKDFAEYKQGVVTHQGWGVELDGDNPQQLQYVTGDVVVDFAEAASTHSNHSLYWDFPEYAPKIRGPRSYGVWDWQSIEQIYNDKGVHPSRYETIWANEYSRMQKIAYCSEIDSLFSHKLKDDDTEYKLQEQDFELLPHRVFGYVLQKRKFLALDIRNMKPIKTNEASKSKLIIDEHHRLMLDGLIGSHFQKKNLREKHGGYDIDQEFIANKGRGLVVLLYGVPGVGKTSTAEEIAHSWHKPLLPVTCGNLGTEADVVEVKLKEIFRLGKKWDCILLMDEADVFLSERTPTAVERNALVSVFLRELEYFDGVLFLTTNLPGGIDEAFKSRIHITLYYPHLNEKDTISIWRVNLERLAAIEEERARLSNERKEPSEPPEPPLTINQRGIKRYAKKHFRANEEGKGRWNGRQIRNAFLIASALAHFEKNHPDRRIGAPYDSDLDDKSFDINPRHFDIVAKVSLGFEQYLAEAKGRIASDIMYQRGQRADFIQSLSELEPPERFSSATYNYTQAQESRERLHAPDPYRSQGGRRESPPGRYNHNQMEDRNWTPTGSVYGGQQGRGNQERDLETPQQDLRRRSNPNHGGSAQSRRDIGFQDSPSPFQQNHPNDRPSGKKNMNDDSESDSDS